MPEYLAPGVYVEEVDTGSRPIEGVSTSTTGMIGLTERGPVNVPILITGTGEFNRWFGGPLDIDAYRDLGDLERSHGYLWYAIDGFFRNRGRRVYVVRVLPGEATPATRLLFDRGTAASAATQLLRAAPRGSATTGNPPPLYVLDAGALADDDWIRIGDGSRAEYAQLDGAPVAGAAHLAVDTPLGFGHEAADPIREFAPAVQAEVYTLVGATPVGAGVVTVRGANQAEANLLSVGQFLEIGQANVGELRRIAAVAVVTPTDRGITLEAPLQRAYANGAMVRRFTIPAAPPNPSALDLPASARDLILYSTAGVAAGVAVGEVVEIGAGTPRHEVRRVSQLRAFDLAQPAYDLYPPQSVVEQVTLVNDTRQLGNDPAAGDRSLQLDRVTGLAEGMRLIIDPTGLNEQVVVTAVNETTRQVDLRDPLVGDPGPGDTVVVPGTTLTAAAEVGGIVLSLANRLGLLAGDVLRLGAAPAEEFVTIAAIPGERGAAPDAGAVVLARPLARAHANATAAQRLAPPATVAGRQVALTVLTTPLGSDGLVVNAGQTYAAGELIQVRLPSGSVYFHRLEAATDIGPDTVTLATPLLNAHDAGAVVAERQPLIEVEALDDGDWGNRLLISVEDEESGLVSRALVTDAPLATQIRLSTLTGVEPGSVLELSHPATGALVAQAKVRAVDLSANNLVTLDAPGLTPAARGAALAAIAANAPLAARSREFRLSAHLLKLPDPAVPGRGEQILNSETFRNLSMDPRHSRYIEKVIGDIDGELRLSDRRPEGESLYIRVRDRAAGAPAQALRLGPETLVDRLPSGRTQAARHPLRGGGDSLATLSDDVYRGLDDPEPVNRTGLFALKSIDDVSIVAAPGQHVPAVQQALIDHCEEMRYRFAVLDSAGPPDDALPDVQAQRQLYETTRAALYYPWLTIPDPMPDNLASIAQVPIPPSGHVAGIYARVDNDRGVHKAPANEVVFGVSGLRRRVNKGEHDILNPVAIDVIRDFRPDGRGIRVWGARVLTSDPALRYVSVRRLMLFLEKSIERGLQWVVFEPNAEPLWARVRRTIGDFLTVVWRNGALEGTTPAEAFFVKCDRQTMTQADIDLGRMIVLVGVAPVKPAEFVIIRIGQLTRDAQQ